MESALILAQQIKEKKLGCVELTRHHLDTIKALEPDLNAFTSLQEEAALARAADIQARIDAGEELPPLAGVPMAIKDNICTVDAPTTCASKMLAAFTPPYNATVTEKLLAGGAIPLGKLNMDEFAMGGSSETSHFGPVKNPWDLSRVPGGSSGGSAAAVAAGEIPYALGSDTGGSIRQPCSFCGVSGIKPTYGTVSRYGLVAFASSLDQVGPVASTIEDCAAILTLIGGRDVKDSTSTDHLPDFSDAFTGDLRGLKIGIPKNYFAAGLDDGVAAPILTAARQLEALGATVAEMELPLADYAIAAYYVVACAEASSNLSRYDGVKYGFRPEGVGSLPELYLSARSQGFGLEVKRRIMLGSFVLSSGYFDAYYQRALKARRLIKGSFDDAFRDFDLILCPNAPTAAFPLGENCQDPLKMYLGDIYTVSVNLAGLPAVSVPCGFSPEGLPVGLQFIGRPYGEATLVRAAHAFQRSTDYHLARPALTKGGTAG